MNNDISYGDAAEIRRLDAAGYGRNTIAMIVGTNASAVKAVLNGERKTFNENLTTKDRQQLINGAFGGR